MKKVCILGGTTYDVIVYLKQLPPAYPHTIHHAPMREGCGSTGAGKALALQYLQVPNTLYAAIGKDWYGQAILSFLRKQAVHFIPVYDEAGTERHINLMDSEGGRISMFITQSSVSLRHNEVLLQQLLDACDIIVLNIIPYCMDLIKQVVATGKPVWTDLHDYTEDNPYHQPFIAAAQFIQLSSDNLPAYKPVMENWIAMGKQMVVCTHGKKGATVLTPQTGWIDMPAVPGMAITDSNGAGDSFFAGFLFAWLHHKSWQDCLRYGLVCGASAVTDTELAWQGLNPAWLHQQVEAFSGVLQPVG